VLFGGLGLLSLPPPRCAGICRTPDPTQSPGSRQFHYPHIFVDAASRVTDTNLWMLAARPALYAAVRGVEAYGLWYERRWAEWFALIAGGVYVPVEIYELIRHPSWMKAMVLTTNLMIVGLHGVRPSSLEQPRRGRNSVQTI